MLNAKKGTTGAIFIMSLVWRSPWQRIESKTSRTRCQHSITRLPRRWLDWNVLLQREKWLLQLRKTKTKTLATSIILWQRSVIW